MAFTKAALRSHGELCSLAAFYGTAHSNSRNDVSALRKRGWVIRSEWATHGETDAHVHYTFVSEAPVVPVQLSLVTA